MTANRTKYIALFLLLGIGFGCKSFSGLTNRGGTEFTVEIRTDEADRDRIAERAVGILQTRLDAIGLRGETTRAAGRNDRISVRIYGTFDPERIKRFLFTANQLELKKVAGQKFQAYPDRATAGSFAGPAQEVLPYSEASDNAAVKYVIVEKQPVIDGDDIRDAREAAGSDGQYLIQFSLKPEGAQKFGDWTSRNVGSSLAIVLDKKVISAPVIRGIITESGQIDGGFTKQSAADLALSLKSGYLPATLQIVEEKTFE